MKTATAYAASPYLGRHIIAEFFGADFDALNKAKELEEAMCVAAKEAGATVLKSHSHFFEPHGVSSVVIIQESNLCIHTWPEFGYAAADFFTCGDTVNPWKSFESLKTFLKAKNFNCVELQRGSTNLINEPTQFINGSVQTAIRVAGGDDTGTKVFQEAIQMSVPEGYTAYTAHELNPILDQHVTTITKVIEAKKTKYQKVVIGDNKWWGKVMWVDDVLNVTERDEFVYHELMVHVPMFIHPKPTRVLIIGGGDGGAARELLKHPNVTNATMIDIDEELVMMAKKHMPMISNGAFDSPNLNLIFGDGIALVKEAPEDSYDVIIVDSTDPLPDSVGEVLFTKEFYENCHRILSPNGCMSTQALMPMRYDADIFKRSMGNIQHAFGKEKMFVFFGPTDSYNGQTSFCLGFKGDSHPKKVDKARVKEFEKTANLHYYNYGMHNACLCLPNYVRDILYE